MGEGNGGGLLLERILPRLGHKQYVNSIKQLTLIVNGLRFGIGMGLIIGSIAGPDFWRAHIYGGVEWGYSAFYLALEREIINFTLFDPFQGFR